MALSPEQLSGLYAAAVRLAQGKATPDDKKNLDYAAKQGYRAPSLATIQGLNAAAARVKAGKGSPEDKKNLEYAKSRFGFGAGGVSGTAKPTDPYASLPEPMRSIYQETKKLLDELKKRGQVINPNIEITPEKAAEFMKKAEKEINPYYSTQLKLAREGFLSSLGYDAESLARFESDLERKYTQVFRGVGEQAADVGFAQSGVRRRAEQELDTDTQRQIEESRGELVNRSEEMARAFAQTYGGAALKSLAAPSLGATPQFSGGEFGWVGGATGIYSLSPGLYDKLIGSQEFQRRAAVQSRASELESAFRTTEAARQYRNLYI